MNLNQDLYQRFNLQVNLDAVQRGFRVYLKQKTLDILGLLNSPDGHQNSDELWAVNYEVITEICRQTHRDPSGLVRSYDGFESMVDRIFSKREFNNFLFDLQVMLNVIWYKSLVRDNLLALALEINSYLDDFPVIGLKVKVYKSKAPQIYPTNSKLFSKIIESTISALESRNELIYVAENFEEGLSTLLIANTKPQLKNVVEDVLTSCDELAKVLLKNTSIGVDKLLKNKNIENLGINHWQKKSFGELVGLMHEIKHGDLKNFDKDDIWAIVAQVGSFIQLVVNKRVLSNSKG